MTGVKETFPGVFQEAMKYRSSVVEVNCSSVDKVAVYLQCEDEDDNLEG